jgi:PadR family transcriptional regulator PadR
MDEKWKSQFRKGFLELCILELLSGKARAYGLEILDLLKAKGLELSEGTLYPLLTRLLGEGKLEALWETPDSGHPRKFYALGPAGKEHLVNLEKDFEEQERVYRAIKEER